MSPSSFDHIILVHHGALGDFLAAWPAILSLRRHFDPKPFYWAGRPSYSLWLQALNIQPASRSLQVAVDALYTVTTWPVALEHSMVIWFGLWQPPWNRQDKRLWFVRSIVRNCLQPPAHLHARQLGAANIAWVADWLSAWQRYFGACCKPDTATGPLLLFPGAGHRAKQWPLENYCKLAELMQQQGMAVEFVLGPAESERGMRIPGFACRTLRTLNELQTRLQVSRYVIGNDSGPMHLAGYLGLQGVVLFGPAAPAQWAPPGLIPVVAAAACAPCTQDGRIECANPICMAQIDMPRVQAALAAVFKKKGTLVRPLGESSVQIMP